MTHSELVQRADRWMHAMGCSIVLPEMVTYAPETPDCIGFRDRAAVSLLVECKASRADFFADAKKAFRRNPEQGMGLYRYMMCVPGLIRPEELPARWGLLYCHPKRVEIVVGKNPKRWDQEAAQAFGFTERALSNEIGMLHSALNRIRIDLGEADFNTRVRTRFMDRKDRTKSVPAAASTGAGLRAVGTSGLVDVPKSVPTGPAFAEFMLGKPMASPDCWCETCDTAANHGLRSRMSLCPACGNKRCPRATHHDQACTGSNEPGQSGSSWAACKSDC